MRTEFCGICRFWGGNTGRCYRYAPRPSTPTELRADKEGDWDRDLSCWPVTDELDWCGEWEGGPCQLEDGHKPEPDGGA